MRVEIVGEDTTAFHIARLIKQRGDEVRLVCEHEQRARELAAKLELVTIVEEATSLSRREPGVDWMPDVVVALRPCDWENLAVCLAASRLQHVPHTVALVHDPELRPLFEDVGLDTIVSVAEVLGLLVEQHAATRGIKTLLSLSSARVEVLDVQLDAEAPAAGQRIGALGLPTGALISAVLRDGAMILPRGAMMLEAGDELVIFAYASARESTLRCLLGRAS